MPPEDLIRLQHMLEAATKAKAIAEGRQLADLERDEPLLLALIKYLEIIAKPRPR